MVYNNFNLIDPFRQLAQPGGALAENAFFYGYLSPSTVVGPFLAMTRRRWALAVVGMTYLIVCFLPALASESIFVDTNWDCPKPDLSNTNNPCHHPRLTTSVTVLRALQALLALAAIAILFIASLLQLRKTGLPSNPSSIAAIGSLMRHPSLLQDLNHVPVGSSSLEMRRALQGKTYCLGTYRSADGKESYGIRPTNEDEYLTAHSVNHKYTPIEGSLPFSNRVGSSTKRFKILDFVLFLFVLGTFGVILAYYLDHGQDSFNQYFASGTFGPRFILTLAVTVLATLWKSVEQSTRSCSG